MRTTFINLRIASLMLGRDISDMVGDFNEFIATIVRLPDDTLESFCYVMLEAGTL
jgi:hypothetical protein